MPWIIQSGEEYRALSSHATFDPEINNAAIYRSRKNADKMIIREVNVGARYASDKLRALWAQAHSVEVDFVRRNV